MSFHSFLVFVHVLGAAGLAAAIGVEAAALGALRRARTPAEAGGWVGVLGLPARIGGPAMLATLASGIWMMATVWGHQPWILAAFVGLVAMGAAGGAVTGRRMRRIRAAIATEAGPELAESFRSLVAGRPLAASLRIRVALGVGILGLMTAKPGAAGSWLILALAAAAGVVAGALAPSAPSARDARQVETIEA